MTHDEILKQSTPRPWSYQEDEANAKLIVLAVNSYEAMREALLDVRRLWDKHGLGDDDFESEPVYNKMVAALALSEGKQ